MLIHPLFVDKFLGAELTEEEVAWICTGCQVQSATFLPAMTIHGFLIQKVETADWALANCTLRSLHLISTTIVLRFQVSVYGFPARELQSTSLMQALVIVL